MKIKMLRHLFSQEDPNVLDEDNLLVLDMPWTPSKYFE